MVRIVTDTASDMTLQQAKELDVEIVPLNVTFDETPYYQLEDADFSQFYSLLETCKELPKTSQPAPDSYLTIFEEAMEAGDEVVVICLSSGLSGTYQSACIARDLSGHPSVYVVDSRTAIMGLRLLVEYAAKLRQEGKQGAEIAQTVEEAAGRVVVFGALDTLKYLRKGGRIPKTAELVGSMLNIKPLVTLNAEGKIDMAGKARGHAGSIAGLIKLMDERADFDPIMPVYFGFSKEALPTKKFQKIAEARYGLAPCTRYAIGSTIGTHVGPGAVAVAYLEVKAE